MDKLRLAASLNEATVNQCVLNYALDYGKANEYGAVICPSF